MFSGNCSLDVQKAKCIRVWPRRGGTERKSSGARPLSCIQVSWDVSRIHRTSFRVRQAVEGGEGTPTGTHPRQGRVDGARASPEPQPHGRFQPPPPPVCVRAFLWMFQGERLPHKKNDSQQARQQMLPFNELQASELLFRGLILSHRALYTAGTWLQWVTDP